jgi:membrane fusion protein (multidrug efflux system)
MFVRKHLIGGRQACDRHPDATRRVKRCLLALAVAAAMLPIAPTIRAQQAPAVPVGTTVAEKRDITQSSSFVGRIEAVERVEIRARITGFLQEVSFREGKPVREGDLLYRIEPATFQAALQQAQGALLDAQGRLANATAQRERTQQLVRTEAAARATLDERIAAERSAQGGVVMADADLKTANVNLGYTEIRSPITGEAGRSKLTKGNVVSPDSGVLTVVVSRDPMYVVFPVSQRELLEIGGGEERRKHGESLNARVRFSDGTLYDQVGRLNFIDVTVDRATDTVQVRGTLPNPNGVLIDGQLVQVLLEGGKADPRVLVPQAALLADQQGTYVFVVVEGKATIRRVKVGGELGANAILADGLSGGELVVVQGMELLRPGASVSASPVPAALSRN